MGMPPAAEPPGAPAAKSSPLAITALVLGIVGVCFLWIPFVGLLPPIAAIVLGFLGKKQCDENPHLTGRGMAVAGIVLGFIGVGLAILAVILLFVADMAITRFFEDLEENQMILNFLNLLRFR